MHGDRDDNLAIVSSAASTTRAYPSLDPLPLGPPVLEPDLHLEQNPILRQQLRIISMKIRRREKPALTKKSMQYSIVKV